MKQLFKHTLRLQFKNIAFLFFCIGTPIIWVVLNGLIIKGIDGIGAETKSAAFSSLFPVGLLFYSYSAGFIGASMDLANARINRQLKQLSLAKISPLMYTLNLFLVLGFAYLIALIPVMLIAIFWFSLHLNWMLLLSCFVFPFLSLFFSVLLAVIIANIFNNIKTVTFVVMILFYIILFTSNGFLVGQDENSRVMKYIKLLTPAGCISLISSSLYNNIEFSQVWYAYLVLIIHASWISYAAIKLFKWT
ncbi:ABC transporter permease [Spiroplasma culicicola]|uniref:ABC transporter permease n=1 Tax=Spiroplasma culicicola AES-1 TaxID=1276246 RepID=W6A777_9MOLU|nr:ABC transporter permease [Spiroplasma culicicola]AHI52998.1 hypothetical protein SCULI_v1c06570 [Spiroplasma culicicola AES-1]